MIGGRQRARMFRLAFRRWLRSPEAWRAGSVLRTHRGVELATYTGEAGKPQQAVFLWKTHLHLVTFRLRFARPAL